MRSLALCLIASAALAAGVPLNPASRYEFTDCASGGSASQAVAEGTYLMRVTDSDVFLCYAATCASGGEKFPTGTVILLTTPRGGQTMSCRSTASNADVILTLGQ